MKVADILSSIDNGHMALPEFQRGYVWNRDQVRALMTSLYHRHPAGSLLVWLTAVEEATHRGDQKLAPGVVKLLLDGQQRITTLYGVIRGKAPEFFEGNADAFKGIYFHLGDEEFRFYQPMKMSGDPLWVDVTKVMQDGIGYVFKDLMRDHADDIDRLNNVLTRLHGIKDVDFYEEVVTGEDKTIDVVVDIFNRVNSGGTKLSKGDLALAKICAEWPAARMRMRTTLQRWRESDLQVHHIFPKSLLYQHANGYGRAEVNAVANFCFLSQDTNLSISNRRPEDYFAEVEDRFPGALESQWIPTDRSLWSLDNYPDFLEARKKLLAETANAFLDSFLHGSVLEALDASEVASVEAPPTTIMSESVTLPGAIGSEEEEEELMACNVWVLEQGLPGGELMYPALDEKTGQEVAILDLAWPRGLQEGLSQPVALLLDEGPETLAAANAAGFRYFTDVEGFKGYVNREVLASVD